MQVISVNIHPKICHSTPAGIIRIEKKVRIRFDHIYNLNTSGILRFSIKRVM